MNVWLCEMKGYCATGHIARFVNVMQGFVDDEGLQIHMESEEQCNAVVRHFLTEALKGCEDDDVIEGVIDQTEAYIDFLCNAIDEKRNDWVDQYGEDFGKYINDVTNDFVSE